MKVLLDQSLPFRAAGELRSRGYESAHAREVGLARATDAAILDWCRENGYVAVTPDADFPTILVLSHATAPSVIRLDAQGRSAAAIADVIIRAIEMHAAALRRGALVTVRRHVVTVRDLPFSAPLSED